MHSTLTVYRAVGRRHRRVIKFYCLISIKWKYKRQNLPKPLKLIIKTCPQNLGGNTPLPYPPTTSKTLFWALQIYCDATRNASEDLKISPQYQAHQNVSSFDNHINFLHTHVFLIRIRYIITPIFIPLTLHFVATKYRICTSICPIIYVCKMGHSTSFRIFEANPV